MALWWVLIVVGISVAGGLIDAVGPCVDRLYRGLPEGAVLSRESFRLLLQRLTWLIVGAVAALAVAVIGIVGLTHSV